MENLICNMMQWSNVTEQVFAEKREIATNFGETLSWEYLCYVRKHPIIWNVPTCILYGEHDNLTSIETVSAFAKRYHADLTVMPGGEHCFIHVHFILQGCIPICHPADIAARHISQPM